jgi:hypothetical protein
VKEIASELAKKIYQLEWSQIDVIDEALQEVRDTLTWLLASKGAYLFHEDECPWQSGPDDGCDCRVQRARDLMGRMKVK